MNLINVNIPTWLIRKISMAIDDIKNDIHDRLASVEKRIHEVQTINIPDLVDDIKRKLDKSSKVMRDDANLKTFDPAKNGIEEFSRWFKAMMIIVMGAAVLSTIMIITTAVIAIMKMAI